MTITSTRDKLRVTIGDTDTDDKLFPDDQLDYFLSLESDDVDAAALRACDAAEFALARAYDVQTDGQSFKRSQMAEAYSRLAKRLRDQGVTTSTETSGVTAGSVTKVDGYSDDIPNSQVSSGSTGRRARSWYQGDPDVIP